MKRILAVLLLAPSLAVAASYTIVTNAANMGATNYVYELATVAEEMERSASYIEADDGYEVGDNFASAANSTNWTIRRLQSVVLAEYDSLWSPGGDLQGKTNYTIRGDTGDDGALPIPSTTEFYLAAGVASNGFRRAQTNFPTSWTNLYDSAYTYGPVQAGDIYGPWIIDDLQKCFTIMTSRVSLVEWDTDGIYYTNRQFVGSATTNTWAAALADASAQWDVPDANFPWPQSYIRGIVGSTTNYNAQFFASHAFAEALVSGTGVTRSVDFYARSAVPGNGSDNDVWDNQGYSVLSNAWNSFYSTNVTPAVTGFVSIVTSLGNATNEPTADAEPPAPFPSDAICGWTIKSAWSDSPYATVGENEAVLVENFTWSYTR